MDWSLERDRFVGLLGGCMDKFEELVLFTGKEGDKLRRSYKRLVRLICKDDMDHNGYDYRVVLNR
jgi:hypothetical protein